MAVQDDPLDYCLVDENESLQHSLPLPEEANGFADDQELPADKFNTIALSAAKWARYHDQGKVPVEQVIGDGSTLLSDEVFEYTTVPGLDQTLVDDTFWLVLGRFVPLTSDRLTASGQAAILSRTFAASKDTHFYLAADGTITVAEVAIATPPSPPAGTIWIHTVTTTGTDILSQTSAYEAPQVRTSRPWCFEDVIRVEDTGGGFARLDFGTDTSTEGWYLETQANGLNLRLYELNDTNVEVIDFGDVSNPIAISRDVTMGFALTVADAATFDGDVSMGDGETSSAAWSGWLRTRTQTASDATRDSWGEFKGTSTAKNVTPSQTYSLASGDLPDGSYAGYVRLSAVRANGPNSTMAHLEYNVTFTVSSGTAAIVNSGGVYVHDAIGFSGWALGASGAAVTFDITIPALGYNVNLSAMWTVVRVTQS